LQHDLAGPYESGGDAAADAALGQGGKDLAEDMVDIGGGMEVTREGGGKFLAELAGFEILLLDTCVVVAEGRVEGGTEHAAAAPIGIREETEFSGIGGAFGCHG
jgi:hypothetical protein